MMFSAYAEGKETVSGMQLVSCGHIFAKPGREINRPNGRGDWLLFYIEKENETFELEQKVTAPAGSFILYAPGEQQKHAYLGNKTAEFYYVHFQCEALPEEIHLETSRIYTLPYKKQTGDIFEAIIEETTNKQPYYEKLCIYKLLHLLALFERESQHINSASGEHFNRIARAVQNMNKQYNVNYTLADYANMCNMSKYHFLRMFRETTGTPPLEYRNRIRLEHAKELLQEEKLSIEEVSGMLGYTSASYFSSAFKKAYGVSPKQYQKAKLT